MNRSRLKPNLTLLAVIAALSLFASSHTIAQDITCTLSGRVLDVEGNPIANMPIAIQPFAIIDGHMESAHLLKEFIPDAYVPLLNSQTDEVGQFSVTGIKPGPIQFVAHLAPPPEGWMLQLDDLHYLEPDAEVLSIKMGAITFYPHDEKHPPWGGITFGIEPGAHIENIEVTVKPRMHIRGRIVFADGTPLANAKIRTKFQRRHLDGMGTGTSSGGSRTDGAGYFVKYVDDPGFYTVAVDFQELTAASEQFILEAGQRYDDLVLTFDSESVPINLIPDRVELSRSEQWALNPANNHSYKRIHCGSWEDAQAKAITEGAYLVAINDVTEQAWLVSIFGNAPHWIGLINVGKEDKWEWTSGEPVTYTNWAFHKLTTADKGEEDYVFMGLSPDGRWHKVGPQSSEWQMPRMAILEMEVLPTKSSTEER